MQKDNIAILNKNYDLLLYLIPVLSKFPRDQKFLLSDRIENILLDMQELIINGYYSKEKMEYLQKINLKLENLRYLIRLCYDLKFISVKRYEFISKCINEIGKELGAWIKYINYAKKKK